jgi:hypothetical protein
VTGKHPALNFVRDGMGFRTSVAARDVVLRGSRLVLVVHGYNNNEDEASKSYDVLFEILGTLVPSPEVLRSIWEVYWPGYVRVGAKKRTLLSALSYPMQVRKAVRIGRALARFLSSVAFDRQPMDVLFIAHSLGCRVVLEAIRGLSEDSGISVKAICLMAAAVPVAHVSASGSLRHAADTAEKRYILHSPADRVLRRYFRAGQLGDRSSEAVGRFGNPRSFWDLRLTNVQDTGLDHGDYYSGVPKADPLGASRTAPMIGRLLGRSLPMYIRYNDPYVVKWDIPSNMIGANRIPSRTI